MLTIGGASSLRPKPVNGRMLGYRESTFWTPTTVLVDKRAEGWPWRLRIPDGRWFYYSLAASSGDQRSGRRGQLFRRQRLLRPQKPRPSLSCRQLCHGLPLINPLQLLVFVLRAWGVNHNPMDATQEIPVFSITTRRLFRAATRLTPGQRISARGAILAISSKNKIFCHRKKGQNIYELQALYATEVNYSWAHTTGQIIWSFTLQVNFSIIITTTTMNLHLRHYHYHHHHLIILSSCNRSS